MGLVSSKAAEKVVSLLKQRYGRSFHRNEDPFFVLIVTVLSARNRDSQTYKAASALFNKFPTMKSIAAAKISDIEKTIKFIGLFRQKAKRVKQISQLLLQKYDEAKQNLELMLKYSHSLTSEREKLCSIFNFYDN